MPRCVNPLGMEATCKLYSKVSQKKIEHFTSLVTSQNINHPTTISHDEKVMSLIPHKK
jgi:hypothetical protein